MIGYCNVTESAVSHGGKECFQSSAALRVTPGNSPRGILRLFSNRIIFAYFLWIAADVPRVLFPNADHTLLFYNQNIEGKHTQWDVLSSVSRILRVREDCDIFQNEFVPVKYEYG